MSTRPGMPRPIPIRFSVAMFSLRIPSRIAFTRFSSMSSIVSPGRQSHSWE